MRATARCAVADDAPRSFMARSFFPHAGAIENSSSLLEKVARHALARVSLRRADIVRHRFEECLPRLPLLAVRDAIECLLQAESVVAGAAQLSPAGLSRASPPQREGIAITPLLQAFLGRKAARARDRRQLRFALLPGRHDGGHHRGVVGIFHVIIHGTPLPFSRRALAPELCSHEAESRCPALANHASNKTPSR
jgi:hypothetical protein